MGILDFLKRKPEPTATVAKERLRIIVAQERSTRGAPDYLPLMRNEPARGDQENTSTSISMRSTLMWNAIADTKCLSCP